MKTSARIRQLHRWLSIIFTIGVIANLIAAAQDKYTPSVGLTALLPLILLMVSGLYMFVLPYAAQWRSHRRARAGASA